MNRVQGDPEHVSFGGPLQDVDVGKVVSMDTHGMGSKNMDGVGTVLVRVTCGVPIPEAERKANEILL